MNKLTCFALAFMPLTGCVTHKIDYDIATSWSEDWNATVQIRNSGSGCLTVYQRHDDSHSSCEIGVFVHVVPRTTYQDHRPNIKCMNDLWSPGLLSPDSGGTKSVYLNPGEDLTYQVKLNDILQGIAIHLEKYEEPIASAYWLEVVFVPKVAIESGEIEYVGTTPRLVQSGPIYERLLNAAKSVGPQNAVDEY